MVTDIDVVVKEVPVPRDDPPVNAAYQLIVPADDVAPKVTVPVPQREPPVVPVIESGGLMVSVIASLTAPHGPAGLLVVMVSVTLPAVISPAEGV